MGMPREAPPDDVRSVVVGSVWKSADQPGPDEVTVTRIDPRHGQVEATSPGALKDAGNEALATDPARATHMYTLGIDLCLGKSDAATLSAAEWFELDRKEPSLHALLSNRSFAHLQLGDVAAALVDAEHCCLARPDFVKGHNRLLAALAAASAPASERLLACARGLRACPSASSLKQAQAQIEAELAASGPPLAEMAKVEAAEGMALTRRVAEDKSDPRRFMAAGDLGSALAVGAHGVAKDVEAAERYLRAGAAGGDLASRRHLGLLLLELGRPVEAAEALRAAAQSGDEEAAGALARLSGEAEKQAEAASLKCRLRRRRALQAEDAKRKLALMASQGDERARAMLEQLQRPEGLAF